MMKRLFAIIIAASTIASLSALETKQSGYLFAEAGVPLPNVEHSEMFTQTSVKADGELYVYASDDITFFGKGQAIYDKLGYQSDTFDASTSDGQFGIIVKEAWFDFTANWWAIRIGRQINAWGKADVISAVDVLCPKNYTVPSFYDTSDLYLGVDAVRLSANYDVYSIDTYCIPFVRSSVLPSSPHHPFQKIIKEEIPEQYAAFVQLGNYENIETNVDNCEYGFKASAYWKYVDVSLYGFYGWDRIPKNYIFKLGGKSLYSLNFQHTRTKMLGADASIPAGDFVFRLEGAYFKDVTMPILELSERDLFRIAVFGDPIPTSVERDQASGVLGIDWIPGSWIISAQYGADLVIGDTEGLSRRNYEHLATLAISKRFFRDTLSLTVAGLLYFQDWDDAFIINAAYNARDNLTLTTSFYYYTIRTEMTFFKNYDHWGGFTAGVRYTF